MGQRSCRSKIKWIMWIKNQMGHVGEKSNESRGCKVKWVICVNGEMGHVSEGSCGSKVMWVNGQMDHVG